MLRPAPVVFSFILQYSAHCSRAPSYSRLPCFHVAVHHFIVLRITSLLIFFALHRRLLYSTRSILFAAFRLRVAIICPVPPHSFHSPPLHPTPSSSFSLIQFILLRSDSPSVFPAIYFTLLRSNFIPRCIPLRFAYRSAFTRSFFSPFASSLHYFASLHYPAR